MSSSPLPIFLLTSDSPENSWDSNRNHLPRKHVANMDYFSGSTHHRPVQGIKCASRYARAKDEEPSQGVPALTGAHSSILACWSFHMQISFGHLPGVMIPIFQIKHLRSGEI